MKKCDCGTTIDPEKLPTLGECFGLQLYNCPGCSSTRAIKTPLYPVYLATIKCLIFIKEKINEND